MSFTCRNLLDKRGRRMQERAASSKIPNTDICNLVELCVNLFKRNAPGAFSCSKGGQSSISRTFPSFYTVASELCELNATGYGL